MKSIIELAPITNNKKKMKRWTTKPYHGFYGFFHGGGSTCNVPDPPTGEEDATNILSIGETNPVNIIREN